MPSPVRIAIVLVLDALALLVLGAILPGFDVDGLRGALVTGAVVGVLNALVWPTLARIALPLSVLTLGFAALALNGALVAIAAWVSPLAEIEDWVAGVVVALGMASLTALLSALLALDDDESWQRNVVQRTLRRRGDVETSDVPGVVFLEIDGLAYDVLRRALRSGHAPTLARWLRDTHRLERWETDWSSQTGTCQAGLLHGDSTDMPAFRWWEKDRGRAMVTNHPRDAAEIERRRSDGRGLLHAGGASRANILSGDAARSMLTMSTALTRRPPLGRDYAAYFLRPYGTARTLMLSIADIARERWASRRQRRDGVLPRINRGWTYALVRAWAVVVQRDLQIATIVSDVLAGRPVLYTTFLAYDEVAHHSGVERPDTLAVLRLVDRQLARVEAALADAPRPYRLVVLADHGQSQGATFKQRYGITLEELVRSSCESDDVHAASGGEDEALAFLGAGVTELARDENVAGRSLRRATQAQRAGGAVTLGEEARRELQAGGESAPGDQHQAGDSQTGDSQTGDGQTGEGQTSDGPPDLAVMASGCLGHITFPREPGRVTRERIDALHPRLLDALVNHPGIAFALVRSAERGALVIGPRGTRFLDEDDRVEGEDPLEPFGPNAADHVRRTDGFAHCPDIVLNSTFWERDDEVAAFEELVGSHGGMGGEQCFPFVLFPADLPYPDFEVVGPDEMHRVLCSWLTQLGHTGYDKGPPAVPAALRR